MSGALESKATGPEKAPGWAWGCAGADWPEGSPRCRLLPVLQSEGIASTVTSQKNSVQLDGLRPDARYVVQVRARTVAGYGQYSHPAEFETTSERGTCPLWLSLPWPILSVPLLTSALLISRLWCAAAPGAASPHCGFCHSWTCPHGGCCGHCCRLPQVLPGPWLLSWPTRASLGTREPSCHIGELSSTSKLEPQPFWAQAPLAGKALSSPCPCLHTVPSVSPASTGRVDQVH